MKSIVLAVLFLVTIVAIFGYLHFAGYLAPPKLIDCTDAQGFVWYVTAADLQEKMDAAVYNPNLTVIESLNITPIARINIDCGTRSRYIGETPVGLFAFDEFIANQSSLARISQLGSTPYTVYVYDTNLTTTIEWNKQGKLVFGNRVKDALEG
jgi:hypothetical protein